MATKVKVKVKVTVSNTQSSRCPLGTVHIPRHLFMRFSTCVRKLQAAGTRTGKYGLIDESIISDLILWAQDRGTPISVLARSLNKYTPYGDLLYLFNQRIHKYKRNCTKVVKPTKTPVVKPSSNAGHVLSKLLDTKAELQSKIEDINNKIKQLVLKLESV